MGNGASAWDQLSTHSAQLLLCDLQPQIVARSKTIEPGALGKSAGVLLEIARLFSLPTTLSVVPEGDQAPELISELRGSGFAQEKLRVSVSPFWDEATKTLLAQSKRKVLIIGGFATEAVVLHAVLDARAEGYEYWSQWTLVAGCPSERNGLSYARSKRPEPIPPQSYQLQPSWRRAGISRRIWGGNSLKSCRSFD
jgi:hypothetical protein